MKELDEFLHYLGIEWDSETLGCFNPVSRQAFALLPLLFFFFLLQNARTLNDTFAEIRTWMDANPKDFNIYYFDDQEDLLGWLQSTIIQQLLRIL